MFFCPRLVLQTGPPSHQKPVCDSVQPMRVTCPTHLIFIGMAFRVMTDDDYKSWPFTLLNLLIVQLKPPFWAQVLINEYTHRGFSRNAQGNLVTRSCSLG